MDDDNIKHIKDNLFQTVYKTIFFYCCVDNLSLEFQRNNGTFNSLHICVLFWLNNQEVCRCFLSDSFQCCFFFNTYTQSKITKKTVI